MIMGSMSRIRVIAFVFVSSALLDHGDNPAADAIPRKRRGREREATREHRLVRGTTVWGG
jgi:hypothetical protein